MKTFGLKVLSDEATLGAAERRDDLRDVPHLVDRKKWEAKSPGEQRDFREGYPYSTDNRPGGYTYEEICGMTS